MNTTLTTTTVRDLRAMIEIRDTVSQLTWLEGAVNESERLGRTELELLEAQGKTVDWSAFYTQIGESRSLCRKLREVSGVVE